MEFLSLYTLMCHPGNGWLCIKHHVTYLHINVSYGDSAMTNLSPCLSVSATWLNYSQILVECVKLKAYHPIWITPRTTSWSPPVWWSLPPNLDHFRYNLDHTKNNFLATSTLVKLTTQSGSHQETTSGHLYCDDSYCPIGITSGNIFPATSTWVKLTTQSGQLPVQSGSPQVTTSWAALTTTTSHTC